MITKAETEIKLGEVQVAIERLVKEHNISITEWNMKAERVNRILGDLLKQRDGLIKSLAFNQWYANNEAVQRLLKELRDDWPVEHKGTIEGVIEDIARLAFENNK